MWIFQDPSLGFRFLSEFLFMSMDSKTGTSSVTKYRIRKHRSLIATVKHLWEIGAELDIKLLLWLAGVCFVGIAIFATHILTVNLLQGSEEKFESETSSMGPRAKLSVTIYTAPAPFEGSVGIWQAAAINSWLRLDLSPNVILLGEDISLHEFASSRAPRVTVDSDIDFTFSGKPMFHGMVQRALSSSADIVMLIDPDVILLGHVFQALQSFWGFDQNWLLTAVPLVVPSFPYSLSGKGFDSFGAHVDDKEVEAYVSSNGIWDTCEGTQLWAWNGNRIPLHAGVMPPFVYGEGQHNHWLLSEAITSKCRIILDASESLSVFRTQLAWNSSHDISSTSLVSKSASDQAWTIGNSWLASTYGSFYFRPLNFSDISLKLVNCGSLQLEKFCVMNALEHLISCTPLNPLAVGETNYSFHKQKETGSVFYHPSEWTSGFQELGSWTQNEQIAISWHTAGSNTHAHLYSWLEKLLGQLSQRKEAVSCSQKPLLSQQTRQCIDSKLVGSEIGNLPLSYSLEWWVHKVASDDKVVILAVAGNSYRDMLMSWVCRLKNLGLSNFLVSALDDDIFRFAAIQGLPVFRSGAEMNVSRDDCHFGTVCFQKVTKMKSRTVLQILEFGFHVLFSDVDVYWFQDPTKEMMSFGPGHLPAQTDQWNETEAFNEPRRLNSGFYFAWADQQTVAVFKRIIEHGATSDLSEQPSFYDTLCGYAGIYRVGNDICLEPELNMTVHFLDPVKYPNGAYRRMWEKKNVRSACVAQGCRVLHNNWVPGRQNKMKRQIAADLWDYDGSTRMCLKRRE